MRRKKLQPHKSGHTLLIDGDILVYRIGATTNDETEEIAKIRMNQYIDEIFHNSFCSDYRMFLTDGKGNFRVSIYPDYKANRKQERPKHYNALRDYLVAHEGAEVAWGQEADDLLGIEQTDKTIIASIDKDLDMIPGMHYNFVKGLHYNVSNKEGRHKFWCQMLTGDSTDNIPGINKVGPKTAEKLLEGCISDHDYKVAVLAAYDDMTDVECSTDHLNWLGKLLWIRREHGQMWEI